MHTLATSFSAREAWAFTNLTGSLSLLSRRPIRVRADEMSWFRSNRGRVAVLALFALACQVVLSFGHVHLQKPETDSGVVSVALGNGSSSASVPPAAPQKGPSGLADDFCAICASISLAGTLVVPAAPAVLPPIYVVHRPSRQLQSVDLASIDHWFFDARGPPNV